MILIFFGPPGAGKGTQATFTAKELNIPHLSTGNMLRSKLLDQDDLSIKLKQIIDSGNLVSDDVINQIVADRLILDDCKNGFILDGFPRTIAQNNFLLNFLNQYNLSISKIIDIKVNEEIIVKRIQSRSNLEHREDDKDSVIKTRISRYLDETRPLSNYYHENYSEIYHEVDGNQKIENIQDNILKFVKNDDILS